ncbi:MAG: glycoside hydrolase family 127 protein [Kiritimatiellaeota bacterium]|nr:glycoside hydrolase family 127 protein [Kiritimatiellota bacterium]
MSSQRADGWFGPRDNLANQWGQPDLWPNTIAACALQSYYEATGDQRVIDLLTKYFRWQLTIPDKDFLKGNWSYCRGADNMAGVHWLYNRTGEDFLLKLAERMWRNMLQWREDEVLQPNVAFQSAIHGVNIAQGFRTSTGWWMQAGKPELLDAAYRNYDKIYNQFGQMPGGMFAACEQVHPGQDDPRYGAESCSIVELMNSCEILTRTTGDPLWAERCEDAALNSYPASQTSDLKALHYFTAPNMVLLESQSQYPNAFPNQLTFDPHYFRCCQHNVAHGWPYYAENLWLATADNGLCASLYSASKVTAKVGAEGAEVTIAEQTDYPFGEQIAFTVSAAKSVSFPLYLRIPGWCKGAKVAVNGRNVETRTDPRSYLVIARAWSNGDKVTLTLPMELGVRVWAKNKNAVSVDRGPLSFALKIGEEWKRFEGCDKLATEQWPAYKVFPTTAWNYGLVIDPANPGASIQVVAQRPSDAQQPFAPEHAPVVLKAKARKITAWTLDYRGLAAVLQKSPAFTAEPLETVTLIPMGSARLRISAFPVAGTGPDAHLWTPAEGMVITDLRATMENGGEPVVLTWKGSMGFCEIRRDGTVISASHPGLTYADVEPPVGKTCTYTVKALGGLTAATVRIAVKAFDPKSSLPEVNIAKLKPLSVTTGWGGVGDGKSAGGGPLTLSGKIYYTGLGLHAKAEAVYACQPEWKRFVATAGIDDAVRHREIGSIVCQIIAEDAVGKQQMLAKSPVLKSGQQMEYHFDVRLPAGTAKLRLVVDDAGDGSNCDHADWVNAGFRKD